MTLRYPLDGIGVKPGVFKTQGFGEHANDYSQFGMIGHNGIDWAAPLGTPILAIHDGRLDFYTSPNGYGKNARIVFDEEGYTWESVYGHMQKYNGVERQVKTGEVIGYVNSTGFSTGNHLHFGIRKILNGSIVDKFNGYLGYFDPQPYFEEHMTKYFKVNDHGKLGIMILEGFTGTIIFENDFADYQKLLAITQGITDQTPTIVIP